MRCRALITRARHASRPTNPPTAMIEAMAMKALRSAMFEMTIPGGARGGTPPPPTTPKSTDTPAMRLLGPWYPYMELVGFCRNENGGVGWGLVILVLSYAEEQRVPVAIVHITRNNSAH